MRRREQLTAQRLLEQVWDIDRHGLSPRGRERLAAALRLVAEHDGPGLPPVSIPTNPRGLTMQAAWSELGDRVDDFGRAVGESLAEQLLGGVRQDRPRRRRWFGGRS